VIANKRPEFSKKIFVFKSHYTKGKYRRKNLYSEFLEGST